MNPEEVTETLKDCLYSEEELEPYATSQGGRAVPGDAILVRGIMLNVGMHPTRLELHRDRVKAWLEQLPHQFRDNGGGGWSFLNACNLENGTQWTGSQQTMDELFVLGVGLGLAECQLPREMWAVLPGGVPYYVLHLNGEKGAD